MRLALRGPHRPPAAHHGDRSFRSDRPRASGSDWFAAVLDTLLESCSHGDHSGPQLGGQAVCSQRHEKTFKRLAIYVASRVVVDRLETESVLSSVEEWSLLVE